MVKLDQVNVGQAAALHMQPDMKPDVVHRTQHAAIAGTGERITQQASSICFGLLADYQFIAETLRHLGRKRPKPSSCATSPKITAVVDCITSAQSELSYFALHKLFFLVEVEALRRLGRRITGAYIIKYSTVLNVNY